MIVVDTREPKEMQELSKNKWENNMIIKKLDTADYVFDDILAFERKTISDLWGSFVKKRLFNQIGDIIEKYKHPCLIVEGNYIPVRLRKRRTLIMHLINSISFLLPVIRTDGKKDTVNEMDRMYKKYVDNKLCLVERGAVVEKKKDDADTFLCGVPDIDNKISMVIKDYFVSPYDFIMRCYDLRRINVGDKRLGKRAEKIIGFIHRNWKEEMEGVK